MNPSNPFIISGYVSPDYFCDREKETQKIISAVTSGRNITLFSIRRLGKTGLINHVLNKLGSNRNRTLFYMDILPTQNINEFMNLLTNEVITKIESKSEKVFKKIGELFKGIRPAISLDSVSGMPNLSFNFASEAEAANTIDQLFKYLSGQKKKLIIAIDEFQQIVNYPEKNTEALLRSHIQRLTNVNFIFSGSQKHMLTSIFSHYGKPFYQSTEMMELNKLEAAEYLVFIKAKFEFGGIEINNEQIKRILNWTRGHTFYTQFFCNRLFSMGLKVIQDESISRLMYEIMNENEAVYINYRNLLTDFQWKVLRAIAKEGKIKLIHSKEFISKHDLHTPSSVQAAVSALLNKEMIYKDNDEYFIYDVFLEHWLERY